MTKTERWLNLIAFLLDHHYAVTREEILSQVEDYKSAWVGGNEKTRESVRRKFERDKSELKGLGVVLEPLKQKVMADHAGQEVEAYLLRPKDFYLPYLEVRTGGPKRRPPPRRYYLPSVTLDAADLPLLRRAAERVARLADTPLGSAARRGCASCRSISPGRTRETRSGPSPRRRAPSSLGGSTRCIARSSTLAPCAAAITRSAATGKRSASSSRAA